MVKVNENERYDNETASGQMPSGYQHPLKIRIDMKSGPSHWAHDVVATLNDVDSTLQQVVAQRNQPILTRNSAI